MRDLWRKSHYISNIGYLIDVPIQEYDISKANINTLRDANAISEEQYQYFLHCPKIEREIEIGKMQGRDASINPIIKNGIENARRIFMEINGIDDSQILAIRNDAIMVMGDRPMRLDITDRVKFRLDAEYRSFYKLQFAFMYYNFDLISKKEVLDIKGLGEASVSLHRSYMLDFFAELFYTAQIEGIEPAIKLLSIFYSKYINKELDVGYYRELNPQSAYKIDKRFVGCESIYTDYMPDLKPVDISFNEKILRDLSRMYASIYFKQNK